MLHGLPVVEELLVDLGVPVITLEWVKLGISNLVCRLILMSSSACMIDYLGRGWVLDHLTSLNSCTVRHDNISERVQDADVVAMED